MPAQVAYAAYSFSDPNAAHTDKAIAYDGAGERENSLKVCSGSPRPVHGSEGRERCVTHIRCALTPARQAFQAALKHETGKPISERHMNLGVCLMRQERYDESLEHMQSAVKVRESADRPWSTMRALRVAQGGACAQRPAKRNTRE